MKLILKTIKFLYLITGFSLLLIIGSTTWLIRKWLQWVFSINESYLEKAPLTDEVKKDIRINKLINLSFIYSASDRIISWFNKRIYD